MFIDSHCHLHFIDFKALGLDEDKFMQATKEQQIEHMLCVATHLDQYQQLQYWYNTYPNISISIGLHPNETIAVEPEVNDYLKYVADPNIVAIGETGLDYFHQTVSPELQQTRFRRQIRAAIASKNPLIIHTRNAAQDTIQILKEENAAQVGGVFHCFTGDIEFAKQALDLNFVLSFSGIVTFANARDIQAVSKWVPLDKILIETDTPYLAPVPFRGKANQPSYVRYVAEYIAKQRMLDVVEFAKITKENYFTVFGRLNPSLG